MITFTSLLWIWKGEAAGRWFFLTVPEEQSADIKAHAFSLPRGIFRASRPPGDPLHVRWASSPWSAASGSRAESDKKTEGVL